MGGDARCCRCRRGCIDGPRRRRWCAGGRGRRRRRIGECRRFRQDGRRPARPMRRVQPRILVFIPKRSAHDRLSHIGKTDTGRPKTEQRLLKRYWLSSVVRVPVPRSSVLRHRSQRRSRAWLHLRNSWNSRSRSSGGLAAAMIPRPGEKRPKLVAHRRGRRLLEETDIADVLSAALADDWQDAERIAIVEDGGHVVGDRQIGGVDISRHDRDRVGIYPLTDTSEIWLIRRRLIAAADLLRKSGRDGKGCGEHYRGQYARHLKWPHHGPPQTSPHTHPRLRRVALYATHSTQQTRLRLLTLGIRDLRKR
jgi:hypothetical protein